MAANLDEVVALHVRFKLSLRAFLIQPEQQIPDFIHYDNICPLGRWLYEQKDIKLVLLSEFKHLIRCHKRIHETAIILAKQAMSGDQQSAVSKLDPGNEFDLVSKDLMLAVVRLKKVVEAQIS